VPGDRGAPDAPTAARARRAARQEWRSLTGGLGPGIITGAADDDPSGISTYTIAGATFGYQLLWMSLATLPMNFAVQSICARIGLVTGTGLARVIARQHGRAWIAVVVALLFLANVINIGADIGALAASVELLSGIPAIALVAPVGVAIALVEVVVPYPQFARYLKLLTLVVFAYVLGAFAAGPDWRAALTATFVPRVSPGTGSIAAVVAILGTTISPYLFFWQTSEEVEEEEEHGIVAKRLDRPRMRGLIRAANVDVGAGMILANVVFYFVVLTSAAALFNAGERDVDTAAQAAEALRPLAGDAAFVLFALGIIGTGLLAVPVLAGSVAYAVAELFDWPEGLNRTLRRAPQFYAVIAIATLLGIVLNFSGLPAVRVLYIAAVVNGLISPVVLGVIMTVAQDRRVLGEFTCGRGMGALGWMTAAIMGVAAVALLVALVQGM